MTFRTYHFGTQFSPPRQVTTRPTIYQTPSAPCEKNTKNLADSRRRIYCNVLTTYIIIALRSYWSAKCEIAHPNEAYLLSCNNKNKNNKLKYLYVSVYCCAIDRRHCKTINVTTTLPKRFLVVRLYKYINALYNGSLYTFIYRLLRTPCIYLENCIYYLRRLNVYFGI